MLPKMFSVVSYLSLVKLGLVHIGYTPPSAQVTLCLLSSCKGQKGKDIQRRQMGSIR